MENYGAHNVLADEELRAGIKEFRRGTSPTLPTPRARDISAAAESVHLDLFILDLAETLVLGVLGFVIWGFLHPVIHPSSEHERPLSSEPTPGILDCRR